MKMNMDRPRTLVVTLDPGLIQLIRTALVAKDALVSACPSGEGAQDEVTQRSYGLVVVSADVSDGDGYDLTTRLKAADPGISVILVGEDRDGRAVQRAHDAGASGFLLQPVSATDLLQRVETVMGSKWFADSTEDRGESADRHAESIVKSKSGLSADESGYDISVLDHEEAAVVIEPVVSAAPVSAPSSEEQPTERDDDPPANRPAAIFTQELPALAVESFDENHPVSIAVGADITAHAITPVRYAPLRSTTRGGDTVKPADAIDTRIDEMLRPEGKLSQAIAGAVERALADALAAQLPGLLAKLGGSDK